MLCTISKSRRSVTNMNLTKRCRISRLSRYSQQIDSMSSKINNTMKQYSFLDHVVYFVPFVRSPREIVNEEFLRKLKDQPYDSEMIKNHKHDLHKYYLPKYSETVIKWSPYFTAGYTFRSLCHVLLFCTLFPTSSDTFYFIVCVTYLCYIYILAGALEEPLQSHKKYLCVTSDSQSNPENVFNETFDPEPNQKSNADRYVSFPTKV